MHYFYPDAAMRRAIVTTARNAHLITEWRTLCHHLGLSDDDIDSLEYRHTGQRDRCYQVLARWQEAGDNNTTVEQLVEHLRACNCNQVAGEYFQIVYFSYINFCTNNFRVIIVGPCMKYNTLKNVSFQRILH